jgi:hypothetical protein
MVKPLDAAEVIKEVVVKARRAWNCIEADCVNGHYFLSPQEQFLVFSF